MPLSINVGLSRKASENYQSTGYSINIAAELDPSVLNRPDELQEQISGLYAQAAQALDRQAGAPVAYEPRPRQNGQYRRNGNGSHGRSNSGGMTDSQRRAIFAIARDIGVDPVCEAERMIRLPLDRLTVRQASDLIDHLKSIASMGNGH